VRTSVVRGYKGTMSFAPKWKDLLVVGTPLGVLYGITAARDFGTIDSGELATVAARLDVAHPTGYALYTCLGRLAVWLFPGSPILAVNLLSGLFVALAAVVAAGVFRGVSVQGGGDTLPSRSPDLIAWWGGLLLGTSAVAWEQATGNEVYGLHLLLVVSLMGWALAAASRPKERSARSLVAGAYLVGLALANHLSVVFLLPTVVWVWFRAFRRGRPSTVLTAAVLLGLLGFSFNLFLPIRSGTEPLLDWGAPNDWDRFWKHYLADQYSIWHFQSSNRFSENFLGYLGGLPGRFSVPAVLLGLLGLFGLVTKKIWSTTAVLAGIFVVTLVWASGYEIFDLEPYFLPADLVVAVLAVVGVTFLWNAIRVRVPWAANGVVGVLALGCLVGQTLPDWSARNRADDRFVRTHLELSLHGLPPGALFFSGFWDAVVSPSLYLQQVEGERTDLRIVDPELLRRSWYFPQLRRMYPGLLAPVEAEVASFLEQLRLFESGLPYDPAAIESRYRRLISALAYSDPDRTVVFTGDVSPGFVRASVVPEGLVYRVRGRVEEAGTLEPPEIRLLLEAGYRPEDRIHRQVLEYWAQMLSTRVRFLGATGRESEIPPWRVELERVTSVLSGTHPETKD